MGIAADKWFVVRTGRRATDPWIAVHFAHQRFCFESNTTYIHRAERLEKLPLDERLKEHGVVVYSPDWPCPYVVHRRPFWSPDDYFFLVARLLGQRGTNGLEPA